MSADISAGYNIAGGHRPPLQLKATWQQSLVAAAAILIVKFCKTPLVVCLAALNGVPL